jgi:hypothetical protein
MFSVCGLKNISIIPVGAAFAYNDNYWSDEYRTEKIKLDINDEIRIISENNQDPRFSDNGFGNTDCKELVSLLKKAKLFIGKLSHRRQLGMVGGLELHNYGNETE